MLLACTNAHALVINVNDLTGGTQTTALNAFNEAADIWEGIFQDNVTVNIDFNFAALSPGVLGDASSNTVGATFSSVKTALASDITSTNDLLATTNLSGGSSMDFLTNDPSGVVIRDNDGGINNTFLDITRANAKALGLLDAHNAGTDASIEFNTGFSFDFDTTDGLSGFDFVGIAAREIGHALGFVSGVDIVDITSGSGSFAPFGLNDFRVFSVLDLFRYSSNSLATEAGLNDFSTGNDAFFSLDGGVTNIASFSTGEFNGDGNQASHWKDDLGLGIMDPTVVNGEFLQVTANDQIAFDAIGWDLFSSTPVPLPSTLFLMLIGVATGSFVSRRRKTTH